MYISKVNGEAWWCCPHCKNRIITHNATGCGTVNKHVFLDSNVIHSKIEEKVGITYLNSLWLGQCLSCYGLYTAIEITILAAPDDEESLGYILQNKIMGEPTNYVCSEVYLTDSGEYEDYWKCSLHLYDTPLGRLCSFLLNLEALNKDEGVSLISGDNSAVWKKAEETVVNLFDDFQDVCVNLDSYLVQDELSRRSVMRKTDQQRFHNRIKGELLISADIYINSSTTESASEVNLIVPDENYQKEMDLYNRICQFALLHGEDLQGLFQTERYKYMSCFVRDTEKFKSEFENEEVLKPLFNHDKGETAEFLISFPEKANYDGKEAIKNAFLDIIQKHVVTIDNKKWKSFVEQAKEGQIVDVQFESCRADIEIKTREDFVKSNLTDQFEPEFYIKPLLLHAQKVGEVDGHSVWFNPNGFYFYWNKETEFLLESWLTFPAYPYGW